MFFGKKYQDSPFTQEEKLGVRQGPLGNSRALTFLITHDPPGLVAPSFYFILVQLWTIVKVENCLGVFF